MKFWESIAGLALAVSSLPQVCATEQPSLGSSTIQGPSRNLEAKHAAQFDGGLDDWENYFIRDLELVHFEAQETHVGADEFTWPVWLDEYALGKYTVTNKQYADFLNSAWKDGYIDIHYDRDRVVKPEVGVRYVRVARGPFAGYGMYYGLDGLGYGEGAEPHENDGMIKFDGRHFYVTEGAEKRPATWISWLGATAFADFYGFVVPTDAEWEAAGRCFDMQLHYATDNGECLMGNCNFNGRDLVKAATPEEPGFTSDIAVGHPVDVDDPNYPPNPCGMHHMSGNVLEWVSDFYDSVWHLETTEHTYRNPTGPTLEEAQRTAMDEGKLVSGWSLADQYMLGLELIIRGGAYNYYRKAAAMTTREGAAGDHGPDHFGFRIGALPPNHPRLETKLPNIWGEEHVQKLEWAYATQAELGTEQLAAAMTEAAAVKPEKLEAVPQAESLSVVEPHVSAAQTKPTKAKGSKVSNGIPLSVDHNDVHRVVATEPTTASTVKVVLPSSSSSANRASVVTSSSVDTTEYASRSGSSNSSASLSWSGYGVGATVGVCVAVLAMLYKKHKKEQVVLNPRYERVAV